MAQFSLGIDLSGAAVRAVLLEGSAKRYRLHAYAEAPVAAPVEGESPEATLTDALKEVLGKLHRGKDACAVAISSAHCAFRQLSLPFVGEEQIRKVVKFELEGHLHQWSIDDVVVDFYPVAEGRGSTQLLVAAVPKSRLGQTLLACEEAKLDPVAVDLDAGALFNAAMASGAAEEEGHQIFVHVEDRSALFLLIENKTIRLVRSVRIGAAPQAAPPKPEGEAGNGGESAAAGEGAGGGNGGEELFVALEEEAPSGAFSGAGAAPLILRELRRSLASLRVESPLTGVYLSGRWQEIDGLAEALAGELQKEVLAFDFLRGVEHDLAEEEAARASAFGAVAFGAALKMIDVDFGGMNFRQEEHRFTKRFDQIKKELAILVGCLAFVLAMENVYLFKKNQALYHESEDARFRGSIQNLLEVGFTKAEGLTGNKYRDRVAPPDPLQRIRSLSNLVALDLGNEEKKFGKSEDFKLPQSALGAWGLVFAEIRQFESRLGDYRIEKVDANYREGGTRKDPDVLLKLDLVFLGTPDSTGAALDDLRRHLESKGWAVKTPNQQAHDLGGIKTTMEIELRVPEAGP